MSTTRVYTLPELDCPNCAMKLERQVNKIKGVSSAEVTFATKRMTVEFENEVLSEQVIRTVRKFEPEIQVEELAAQQSGHAHKQSHDQGCCGHEHHHEEECCCGHEHHHEEECCCGHEHHHEEECCCGHEHHHEEECSCGHDHHHEEECSCGHDQHHEEVCSCGHDHHHEEMVSSHSHVNGTLKLSLKGLDCVHCAGKIEKLVNEMESVREASVIFSTASMLVDPKPGVDENQLVNDIAHLVSKVESGIEVSLIHDSVNEQRVLEKETAGSFVRKNAKLIIGIILLIIGVIVSDFS